MLRTSEGSAYGAALLAATGSGIFLSVEEACQRTIEAKTKIVPRSTKMAAYDRYYDIYRSFYPTVKGHSRRLAELSSSGG